MIKPRALTSLSVVFPCYNEAANVSGMIDQAVKAVEGYGVDYEIVVVDDGSRDETAQAVRRWSERNGRVKLVQHARNLGYGTAVRSALRNASKELVFLTDGDNQFNLADVEKLFSKIDSCDVVAGYRIRRQDRAHRRFNGALWTRLARLLFGLRVRDVDCAFKLFRRKTLEGLPLESEHLLIHAEILARIRKRGYRIEEVGIPHYSRTAGRSTATGPARMVKSVWELLRLYWRIR